MAISLQKGGKVNLNKTNAQNYNKVCVGLNWGVIPKKMMFGLLSTYEEVDLDGSAALFDDKKNLVETVYFQHLHSKNDAVVHSGDDLTGDRFGDDGKDNEIIKIDFSKLPNDIETIVLFLNSYKKQDFGLIPFSTVRIYEGEKHEVVNELITFNLSNEAAFSGHISMIMGKFYKNEDGWNFEAIGEPTKTFRIIETLEYIQKKYIK